MIKAIAFDVGDIITQFNLDEFRKFIKSRGCSPDKDKEFFKKYKSLYDSNKITTHIFWEKYISQTGIHASQEELISAIKGTINVDPEMKKLLKKLKKKYLLILASNIDPITYEETKRQLGNDLFDKEYLSFKMGKLKSDPSFFTDMLAEQSLSPQEVLFIDDYRRNVLCAESVGIKGLIFIDKDQLINALRQMGLLEE